MAPPSFESRIHDYRPALPDWHTRSTVRCAPRRVAATGDGPGHALYSAALTPSASHPLVVARGPDTVDRLLAGRLYSYLDFTTVLEQEIVNPVVLRLARDADHLDLPAVMRYDAHKIYCDEAYHALFSVDVKRQAERLSGVGAPSLATPRFAQAIEDIRHRLPGTVSDLVDLCAAVVSETLISGTLTTVPADETVAGFVRASLADHAADERTHHAYFAQFMELLWPELDPRTRRLLGPEFADLILAFLLPDWSEHWRILYGLGFPARQVETILQESHREEATMREVRRAARSILALLRKVGVLDDGRTVDHFTGCGLLPGGTDRFPIDTDRQENAS